MRVGTIPPIWHSSYSSLPQAGEANHRFALYLRDLRRDVRWCVGSPV